jgi:sterol desaturase/sphingolipid hydroxylase (fatty acid hydroxylase superfamily)
MDTLLANQGIVRTTIFAFLCLSLIALETIFPRRKPQLAKGNRWLINFGFSGINIIFMRLILPIGLASVAAKFYGQFGLLIWLQLNWFVELCLALILLDFAIYWQHRLFHKLPLLWAFHKFHHSDQDLDASSALRFHPGEMLFSLAYKIALIFALGLHPASILIFEILLSSFALFNHANWNIGGADKYLQRAIVTPDMHRLHHSVDDDETQRNFGFCLSLWDRLFRTYKNHPEMPMETLPIGLADQQTRREAGFLHHLSAPFRRS